MSLNKCLECKNEIDSDLCKYCGTNQIKFINSNKGSFDNRSSSYFNNKSSVLRGTCECRNYSEEDLVILIKEKLFQRWGCLLWAINGCLVLISHGTWIIVLIIWGLWKYFVLSQYICQFCDNRISKKQFR